MVKARAEVGREWSGCGERLEVAGVALFNLLQYIPQCSAADVGC